MVVSDFQMLKLQKIEVWIVKLMTGKQYFLFYVAHTFLGIRLDFSNISIKEVLSSAPMTFTKLAFKLSCSQSLRKLCHCGCCCFLLRKERETQKEKR